MDQISQIVFLVCSTRISQNHNIITSLVHSVILSLIAMAALIIGRRGSKRSGMVEEALVANDRQ